ncbi:MAG TPA: hypothetical protein VIK61_09845 [Acidimicrobiia bacterium]
MSVTTARRMSRDVSLLEGDDDEADTMSSWWCVICEQPLDPDSDDVCEAACRTPDGEELAGLVHGNCFSAMQGEQRRRRVDLFDLSALWLVDRGLAVMLPNDSILTWSIGPVMYAVTDKACAFADWLSHQPDRRALSMDCDSAFARFEQRRLEVGERTGPMDDGRPNERTPQQEGDETVAHDLNAEVWRLLSYPTRGRLLLDGSPPRMTREEVDEIVRADRYAEFALASASEVAYGESFMALAFESSSFNDLMVRMALAGRIDICDSGVVFAIRAAHQVAIASTFDNERLNAWSDVFRVWAEVAEDLAADLEERYAERLDAEESGEMAQHESVDAPTRQAEAAAARARAARSRRRRDEDRSDTTARLLEEGWSAAEIATLLGPPY